MSDIHIHDQTFFEKNQKDFELVNKFDKILLLAVRACERSSDAHLRMIQDSQYSLRPHYRYDFGQDNPEVDIEMYVDDDIYIDISQSERYKSNEEEKIAEIFKRIIPSPMSIPLRVSLHPLSLSHALPDAAPWRMNPQYRISDRVKIIDQDAVERIWGDASALHVFITHKANIRDRAHKLSSRLAEYGIAGFVAHDDIEPAAEWQESIEKALFSSDALIVLLTDDIRESDWTDQEVGIAFGRQLPVFPVKMNEKSDPYGFIGKIQAFKLRDEIISDFVEKFILDSRTCSPAINSLLSVLKTVSQSSKLQEIGSFLAKAPITAWKEGQKETFRVLFDENPALQSIEITQNLCRNLGISQSPPSRQPGQTNLDDEIPF